MRRAPHKSGQKGFSLMEMMIAAAVFVLLCGAAFALLSVAQQRYQTESQVLSSFQEARFGLEEMVRDVNGAGYPPENQFTANSSLLPTEYASTPIAWDPNYWSDLPCQIGTAGGGTCNPTPGDFDMIVERDVDPWRTNGVEWTRYQLQGTVLSRSQASKSTGTEPDPATSNLFVPFVQNVVNDAPAAQIAQFQAIYPLMFPGGNPVPVFQYICGTPTGPQPCPFAGAYNSPLYVTDVEITLIVMAPTPDAQTGKPRLVELHGRGHCLNPIQP
jgi:prepilin-type N-terminal cleavage/methylation domain-containing protein